MKIAIIGTGYVGLVSGVCFASKGHMVTCFDLNKDTIDILKNGQTPIYENGLVELMLENRKNIFYEVLDTKTEVNLLEFDAIIVAVGTPTVKGKIDLSQIKSVAIMIARLLKNSEKYISIILRSTVLPGTTDTFFKNIIENQSGKKLGQFGLGMNPEFLREGSAIEDFLKADRIVMGYEDTATLNIMREMYSSWNCQKLQVNSRSAEMLKYVNNTLLATLISSVNEHANIARQIGGIDFKEVMHSVYLDNRWSPLMADGNKLFPKILDYLKPGCGYGGSCFPKDVRALSAIAKEMSVQPKIIDAVIEVNNNQPNLIVEILKNKVKNISNKRVLILGLAFKPETDDVRDSVSLKIINLLHDKVLSLSAHDPVAIENTKKLMSPLVNLNYVDDWKNAIYKADIIIIATNWSVYKSIEQLEGIISDKIIFDTRSLLDTSIIDNKNYLSFN
tara:strand:- start:1721 stop:3061 length:1341 start_codon:yes stop_codon:yes gene_type:complete